MRKHLPITAAALLGIALCAQASSAIIPGINAGLGFGRNGGMCVSNENANVTVSFNGSDKDVSAAKATLDAKVQEVKALAEQQHFTKFDIQSNNYSINGNRNNYGSDPQFTYNGSFNFSILPADKAVEFMALLSKKGYQANVNVNSYNNGNCPQSPASIPVEK